MADNTSLVALPRLYPTAATVGDSLRSAKQHQQQSLLRVHAILRLVEDHRLRAIEDRVRYLCIAMRGKAVHEDSVLLCMRHKTLIHLVWLEDRCALGGLVFEAHAGADIGVDRIGSCDCLDGILHQRDGAAGCLADLDGLVNNVELWSEAFRRCDRAVRAKLRAVSINEWHTLFPSPT